jgi:hypothetical protein
MSAVLAGQAVFGVTRPFAHTFLTPPPINQNGLQASVSVVSSAKPAGASTLSSAGVDLARSSAMTLSRSAAIRLADSDIFLDWLNISSVFLVDRKVLDTS